MWWTSSSGKIELEMMLDEARSVSHPGPCDADVRALRKIPDIKFQTSKIDAQILRDALREYGAWSADDLADHEANLDRLLWIAGCDIAEENIETEEETSR